MYIQEIGTNFTSQELFDKISAKLTTGGVKCPNPKCNGVQERNWMVSTVEDYMVIWCSCDEVFRYDHNQKTIIELIEVKPDA